MNVHRIISLTLITLAGILLVSGPASCAVAQKYRVYGPPYSYEETLPNGVTLEPTYYPEKSPPWVRVIDIYEVVAVVVGIAFVYLGLREKEKGDWHKAIAIDPPLAYFNRACDRASEGKEQYHRAAADFTEAIELDPEWADAYRHRGALYHDLGKKGEALADYEKFLALSDYKTADEALEAMERHKDWKGTKAFEPLADPIVVAESSIRCDREYIAKRIQELKLD